MPVHGISRIAPVQMGLFGLGAPEIAVIGAVVLFVLGPDKLKELARDAGKALPELKEVTGEALGEFKEASVEAAKAAKEASAPALQELKEAATPVLSEFKDNALKEAQEVAKEFTEGAKAAEVPAGTAGVSADTDAPEDKPV
jgi:sec-independent protein translocase protein TatA